MLFISDAQYYVPLQLCRTAGSIPLFKITETLSPKHIKLRHNILWDVQDLAWNEVDITLNEVKKLPTSITIPLKNKLKVRRTLKKGSISFSYSVKTRYDVVSIDARGW